MRKGRRRWLPWAAAAVVALAGAAVFLGHNMGWRGRILSLKLHHRLAGVSWREAVRAMGPTSLESAPTVKLVRDLATGHYKWIHNPRTSPADIDAGRVIFRAHCAVCHGADGRGGNGPDLSRTPLRHGASDWTLYRTIADGLEGTGMPASGLSGDSLWEVASYIRSIAAPSAETDSGATPAFWDSVSSPPVTPGQLVRAGDDSTDWLTYSGDYHGRRFTDLREIDTTDVQRLRVAWMYQMPASASPLESTPLVVGDAMFVTAPPASVVALDARTGRVAWTYARSVPSDLELEFGRVNRGVAALGDRLYLGTLDAHLVALDTRTGRVAWDVQVADASKGYSITSAPLAVKGEVITGVAGGENGIRGFIDAYDAATGHRLWRFYTIPGPGRPGNDSWAGDSWKTGGGPTWLTGSYDPDLNLICWGVGNPGPDFDGDERQGDDLYTNSVVALDATTGKLRWHFQFTPHGDHDWDAAQVPVLVDRRLGGRQRHLLLWANRNGFFYALDRATGAFLHATPFVPETWATRIDSSGRPVLNPAAHPSAEGSLVSPGFLGGTNWWSPAYSPVTGLMYVPVSLSQSVFYKSSTSYQPGRRYVASSALTPAGSAYHLGIRALDPEDGHIVWKRTFPATSIGGLLATAGGLVFGGNGGRVFALDARTGRTLWRMRVGGRIVAAPIAYRVGGHERVSIVAGRTLLTFALPNR